MKNKTLKFILISILGHLIVALFLLQGIPWNIINEKSRASGNINFEVIVSSGLNNKVLMIKKNRERMNSEPQPKSLSESSLSQSTDDKVDESMVGSLAGNTTYKTDAGTLDVEYPQASRAMGEQGLVQLEISYDSTLNSNQVRVVSSSGYSRLDLAAVQAAQKINPSDISNNSPYLMNVKFELKQNSK